MSDLPQIVPAARLEGRVDGLFAAGGANFVTSAGEELAFGFDGIEGDFHAGVTRKSGGREPWYPRGTTIRNERQVTIVARDELNVAAARMGLASIEPEWIGANMALSGIPQLSMLPASTLLFFEGGVTIKVDLQNAPCKSAGRQIAKHLGRPEDMDIILGFPKHAKRERGLTAWIEKPGIIRNGEAVRVHIPEQWIYAPS